MIDTHIHIGQFNKFYTSSESLLRFLDSADVDMFAVSSTTTCERNYDRVLREMRDLVNTAGNRVMPVLWVLPEMLEDNTIGTFLETGINWRILKIHPQISPAGSWSPTSEITTKLLTLARTMTVPILIHTGETVGCYPDLFEETITQNPDINFILAHGRPVDETIRIMEQCHNCWCDTAFMPTEHIVKLCRHGMTDRVLWGTDYPIPKYFYPEKDMVRYYKCLLSELKESVSKNDFIKITETNAVRLLFNNLI